VGTALKLMLTLGLRVALKDLVGEAEGEPEPVAAPLELAVRVPEELAVAEGVLEGLALLLALTSAAAAEAEPEEPPEAGGEALPVPDGLSGRLAKALWLFVPVALPDSELLGEGVSAAELLLLRVVEGVGEEEAERVEEGLALLLLLLPLGASELLMPEDRAAESVPLLLTVPEAEELPDSVAAAEGEGEGEGVSEAEAEAATEAEREAD
jgi:hypothetical protein